MIKDPRNVLIDVEGMEWDPQIPVAKAIELATEALQNYPSEIEFKVTLTGASASRFHFIKTILTSLGLPPEEADKYLIQSGVENQIRALAERSSKTDEWHWR